MPLVRGKKAVSPKGFQENIKSERKRGKKLDQAVAIAYGEADSAKKKAAQKMNPKKACAVARKLAPKAKKK